jgi:hypothetical protein
MQKNLGAGEFQQNGMRGNLAKKLNDVIRSPGNKNRRNSKPWKAEPLSND